MNMLINRIFKRKFRHKDTLPAQFSSKYKANKNIIFHCK